MARLTFNDNYEIDEYTLILSKKNYEFEGKLKNISDLRYKCNFNSADEISFTVTKFEDISDEYYEENNDLWEKITDLKVVFIPEINKCFSIVVSLKDSAQITKSITGTELGEVELSQIMLYNIEINNDNDAMFKNGIGTMLFRDISQYTYGSDEYNQAKNSSLLHRIFEKAPHYTIGHVDKSLADLKRVATFSINETSLYDFLVSTLAKEYNCLVDIDSTTRTVNFYDLYYYCETCGNRTDYYEETCNKCGSKHISYYGKDTTIFVNKDNLADTITYETEIDSVKNCFRLSAGDDFMTDTIASANPSGRYLYYITEEQRNEMPEGLRKKLVEYDNKLKEVSNNYVDYSSKLYELVDKINYYQHELMPTVERAEINAQTEADKIFKNGSNKVGEVALDIDLTQYTGLATVTTTVSNRIKSLVKTAYVSVDIDAKSFVYKGEKTDKNGDEYVYGIWVGDVTIKNYNNEKDVVTIKDLNVVVNDIYTDYILNEIETVKNALNDDSDEDEYFDMAGIISADFNKFKTLITADEKNKDEISKYSLERLKSLLDGIQNLMDILIEEDQVDEYADLYSFYKDYKDKHIYALKLYDELSKLVKGLNDDLEKIKNQRSELQKSVDLQTFLGEEYYKIFCAYKREGSYSNSNYISDGLENDELYDNAMAFLEEAKNELYKSAEKQHKITSDLKNLLLIPEFEPLLEYFDVGNWIQVQVENNVYRLRLLSYEISFSSIQTINVEFSDVSRVKDSWSDVASILQSAKTMASNYNYVTRQSEKGYIAHNTFKSMQDEGLDTSLYNIKNSDKEEITIDNHGILCRSYKYLKDDFDERQLRIVKNCIAFTQDNWETLSTAIGQFNYKDPSTGKMVQTYGVNAETLIGELILGSRLGIYSSDDKVEMTFDNNGLVLNTKRFNSTDENGLSKSLYKSIFRVEVDGVPMLYIDNEGKLILESAQFKELKKDIDKTIDDIQEEFCVYSKSTSLPSQYLNDKDEYLTNVNAKQYWFSNINDVTLTKENPYLWKRTKVMYKSSSLESTFGTPYCVNGVKGDSITILETWVKYIVTDNQKVIPKDSDFGSKNVYPTDIPDGSYVWSLTYTRYSDGSENKVYGVSHIGKDADAVYTWIAYADDMEGNGLSKESAYYDKNKILSHKNYIGIATNQKTDEWEISDIKDKSIFSWSKFKGDDAESYLWIKYADAYIDDEGNDIFNTDGTPKINPSTLSESPVVTREEIIPTWEKVDTVSVGFDEEGVEHFEDVYDYVDKTNIVYESRKYIGITNSSTQTESNNISDYKWSLVKGNQGENGSFIWIKYSPYPKGRNPETQVVEMYDEPNEQCKYIGISNVKHDKPESKDETSNLTTSYTWSQFIGEDGVSYYTWIKYADAKVNDVGDFYYDSDGKLIMVNMSDEPSYTIKIKDKETGKDKDKICYRQYIGMCYNRTSEKTVNGKPTNGSEDYKNYTWSLIKGEQGDIGITYYLWTMYADDSNGLNMSTTPLKSSRYMGISYDNLVPQQEVLDYYETEIENQDTNKNESNYTEKDKSYVRYYQNMMSSKQYTWSTYMGEQYYMWIRYSKYETGYFENDEKKGAAMSTMSDEMSYIGLAFNKLQDDTCDEAQNPTSYNWSYIKAIDPRELIEKINEWCLSSSSELLPIYAYDENGNPLFEKDENGNLIYLVDDDGNYINENNEKVDKDHAVARRIIDSYELKASPESVSLVVDDTGEPQLDVNGNYQFDVSWGNNKDKVIDLSINSEDWLSGDPQLDFHYNSKLKGFVEDGYMFIWSREHFFYSDGSETVTTPVCSNNLKELITSNQHNKEMLEKYGDWMTLDDNHIELGNITSDNVLRIDKDGIYFTKQDIPKEQATSYWDGDYLNTGNLVVKSSERAQFGRFAFIPRNSDKDLMFLMVGEYQKSSDQDE